MNFFKKNKNALSGYDKISDNIYINQSKKKIIINNKEYNFFDILNVKLVENGIDRIIGSQTGNTKLMVASNKQLINKLDIEIKLNDINNPFISIPFLKLGIRLGFEKNSKHYQEAYKEANRCLSILEMIINNNK